MFGCVNESAEVRDVPDLVLVAALVSSDLNIGTVRGACFSQNAVCVVRGADDIVAGTAVGRRLEDPVLRIVAGLGPEVDVIAGDRRGTVNIQTAGRSTLCLNHIFGINSTAIWTESQLSENGSRIHIEATLNR